jgi:hypothetical protein
VYFFNLTSAFLNLKGKCRNSGTCSDFSKTESQFNVKLSLSNIEGVSTSRGSNVILR